MKKEVNLTQLSNEELIKIILEQQKEIEEKDVKIKILEQAQLMMKMRAFARKKDQDKDDPMPLFDDIELTNKEDEAYSKIEDDAAYTRVTGYKRKKKKNFVNLENLDLKTEVVDHKSDDSALTPINSYESVKILCVIPKTYFIQEHRFHKYKNEDGEIVMIKGDYVNPLGKINVSTGFVANVIVDKVIKSLPLYRQEKVLNNEGLDISRMDLSNYCTKAYEICEPVIKTIEDYIKAAQVCRSDETPLKIIELKNAPNSKTNSYVWAFSTGLGYKPATIYKVGPTRGYEVIKDFFGSKQRYLESDFYSAYTKNEKLSKNVSITNVFCMAHARRRFTDITKSIKVPIKSQIHLIITLFNKIYKVEKEISKEITFGKGTPEYFDDLKNRRLEKIKPIFDTLYQVVESELNTKQLFGEYHKALDYTFKIKEGVYNILKDGRLELDNNGSERKVKDFVIGRKNWLFSNTTSGAVITCGLYSLLRTAVENGLKPLPYLDHLLNKLGIAEANGEVTDELIESLLPWSEAMQNNFKSRS